MDDLVGAKRDDIFLDQELDAVGHRLEKPERSDAIWSVAILDARENLPLEHGHEREERHEHAEERGDVEQDWKRSGSPNRARLRQEREQPLLCENKNLVDTLGVICDEEKRWAFVKQDRIDWPRIRTCGWNTDKNDLDVSYHLCKSMFIRGSRPFR